MKDKYTWEDVSIGQFEQIVSISGMRKNALDECIDILSVMTGIQPETYLDMPLPELEAEIKKIDSLKPDLLKERMKDGGEYTVEGRKYILTPSANQMTAGQFIDYQNTLADDPQNISMLCAILLVPEGKKYGEGYDVLELRETLHEHFHYIDSMGISFFFRMVLTSLSVATLSYSIRQLKKTMKKEKDPEKKQKLMELIKKQEEAIKEIQQTSGTSSLGRS